jgi:hypothetical protein
LVFCDCFRTEGANLEGDAIFDLSEMTTHNSSRIFPTIYKQGFKKHLSGLTIDFVNEKLFARDVPWLMNIESINPSNAMVTGRIIPMVDWDCIHNSLCRPLEIQGQVLPDLSLRWEAYDEY